VAKAKNFGGIFIVKQKTEIYISAKSDTEEN
jgi:hypothetical protein